MLEETDPYPCLVWAHCLRALSTIPGAPDALAVARRIGGKVRKWNGKGKERGRKEKERKK